MPRRHSCHIIAHVLHHYATSLINIDMSPNDWTLSKNIYIRCHIIIYVMSSCICHAIYVISPMSADIYSMIRYLRKKLHIRCHIITHATSSCMCHIIYTTSPMSADMSLSDWILSKKISYQMPCHHLCHINKIKIFIYHVMSSISCHLC